MDLINFLYVGNILMFVFLIIRTSSLFPIYFLLFSFVFQFIIFYLFFRIFLWF